MKKKAKFTFVGAGSRSFCPATIADILLSEKLSALEEIEIYLMDIAEEPLELSASYCREVAEALGKNPTIKTTTDLAKAVDGADIVITAIEVNRYHYWSMDYHIPRRYGFRQIFGENGGPGGMFHFLRNAGPLIEIARAVKKGSPGAWMLNYSNPEAKLIEAVSKATGVNVVGLCHADQIGVNQLSRFLQMPKEEIDTEGGGFNHFGWFTKIRRKSNGEDLYPLLKETEKQIDWLADWDEFALPRLMLRTYGLWPYPGTNHVGEYIAWSDELIAGSKIQYFYDPADTDPWKTNKPPEFVYSFSSSVTSRKLHPEETKSVGDPAYTKSFKLGGRQPKGSGEYGIPIAEAILLDAPVNVGAVNLLNRGYIPNVLADMAVEVPAYVDGKGIHPKTISPLPTAVAAMVSQQGAICQLLIEALEEKSRRKLLQAMLLDPTISNYNNAVALINEMFERQSEILPKLIW